MENLDEKLENLIEYLELETEGQLGLFKVLGGFKNRHSLKKEILKILGISEQCFQCSDFYIKDEMSFIEGTDKQVCQDCIEGLLSGEIKLNTNYEDN